MKQQPLHLRARAGFTLFELSISTAVSLVAFIVLLTSYIGLQKSYAAVDAHSKGVVDQLRALDYISRDARGAFTTTVANGVLTLSLPDYYSVYDTQGNATSAPVNPTITGSTVNYNTAAQPVTVVYSVNNGALNRQITVPRTGVTSTSVVCSNVSDLTSNFIDNTGYLFVSLSFADQFRGVQTTTSPGTTLTTEIYLRNLQR